MMVAKELKYFQRKKRGGMRSEKSRKQIGAV